MEFAFEAAMPYAAGTFYARLRADSGDAWRGYVEHPFVAQLGAGTLPPDEYAAWLAQDYLYLVHYARAYALMVYKIGRVADMAVHASLLHGLLHVEMGLHREQLAGLGHDPERIEDTPETLELVAYSRYMLDRGMAGDALDLAVTLAACLGGYGEIGLRLRHGAGTVLDGNPYAKWIETYAGPAYHALARAGIERLDELAARGGGQARYPALLHQFREAVRFETSFWDAGKAALAAARLDNAAAGGMVAAPRGAPTRG